MAWREPLQYPGSILHCQALVAQLSLPDNVIIWPLRNVFLRTAEQVVAQPPGRASHPQIQIRGPDVSHPAGWSCSSETVCHLIGHTIHMLDGKIKAGNVFPPSCLSDRQMRLSLEVFKTLVVCYYDEFSS